MNIFVSPDERRLRAGWRLAAQLFLTFIIGLGLAWFLSRLAGLEGRRVVTLTMAVGTVSSMAMAARGLDRRPWSDFGLRFRRPHMRAYGLGFALAGLVMGFIFTIEYLAGWITVSGFGWQQLNDSPFLIAFGGYFLWMVIVGFYEELLFRGYHIVNLAEGLNMPGLGRRQAVLCAVGVSSLIFGIMHALNPNAGWISTLNIAFAGVMLAFPFIITGRLSLSIGLHIGWNFFQGGVFGFPVSGTPSRTALLQVYQSGPDIVTGGAFGPEAGLIGLLGLVLVVAGLYWHLNRTGRPTQIHPRFGVYTPSSRHYPA